MEKSKNTIKIMIIQNKVCIPHADTEYFITSHNTYHCGGDMCSGA